MKKSDCQQNLLQQAAACVLVIGSLALTGDGGAATAVGTATATVLEPVSVILSGTLSGTVFTPESFTGSLSLSGPLLRVGSAPPPDAVVTAAGAAPSPANSATVNVARNADGSLSVSGGWGLTFAVSQPGVGVVNIEYN